MIYAGSGDVIFSGKYNAQAQTIEWNAYPDWVGPTPGKNNIQSHGGRITSLTECAGKLCLRHRHIRPARRSAAKLEIDIHPPTGRKRGNFRSFSGLTCAAGPSGQPVLFSSFQGASADVIRIDLSANGARGAVELNVPEFLHAPQHGGNDCDRRLQRYYCLSKRGCRLSKPVHGLFRAYAE